MDGATGPGAAAPEGAALDVRGGAPGATAAEPRPLAHVASSRRRAVQEPHPWEEAEVRLERTSLPGGLTVVSERVPAVRSVALGFWIAGGSAQEGREEAGISHLLEHMLFRGTARFGSREIDQIFDEMGSGLNAETDKESTMLASRVLDSHLPRALEVMAEMVFKPTLEELAAEREVVLQELAAYEDDPQDLIFDRFAEAVFGEHPLGRPVIGRREVVGAIAPEQLRAFHAARYLPRNVVIAAAGSVDHEALVEMARSACPAGEAAAHPPAGEGAPRGDEAASRCADGGGRRAPGDGAGPRAVAATRLGAQDGPPEAVRRVLFERKETEQYHLCVGAPAIARGDDRRFALRVLEGVLGATPSSRLFQEVRERRGLAYSVYTFSSLYASTGELGIYLGTRPENLAEALAVLAEELAQICAEPISDEELARSRECTKSAVALALEASSARMGRLGSSLLFGLPVLSLGEIVARIDAVTAADCHALARELLAGQRLSVAAIGPDEDALRAALVPLDALAGSTLSPAAA
jgi:predicted Zn-dependent peptidase